MFLEMFPQIHAMLTENSIIGSLWRGNRSEVESARCIRMCDHSISKIVWHVASPGLSPQNGGKLTKISRIFLD